MDNRKAMHDRIETFLTLRMEEVRKGNVTDEQFQLECKQNAPWMAESAKMKFAAFLQ